MWFYAFFSSRARPWLYVLDTPTPSTTVDQACDPGALGPDDRTSPLPDRCPICLASAPQQTTSPISTADPRERWIQHKARENLLRQLAT